MCLKCSMFLGIDNKNKNTEITYCTFTNNNASLYGSSIFSNKGNDVTIKYCTFNNSSLQNSNGSCISTSGNMYLSNNIFYNDSGKYEIYIMDGTLEAEDNYFDGNIICMYNLNGSVSANLNYWGYNNIDDIETKYVGSISIDNWLYSSYDNYYTEPNLNDIHNNVTGRINQYKNRLKEITAYKDMRDDIPIYIGTNDVGFLNHEYDTKEETIKIGQQILDIDGGI